MYTITIGGVCCYALQIRLLVVAMFLSHIDDCVPLLVAVHVVVSIFHIAPLPSKRENKTTMRICNAPWKTILQVKHNHGGQQLAS